MIRRWKGEDPGPKPQQALPSSAVHQIAKVYRTSPILQCRITLDLVVIAYFFLLQVGDYTLTTPCRGQHKCTVPLRKGDITFWHETRVIITDSPLERLLQADGATINLANQKNGVKDAKVSHTLSGDPTICPCRSLARLVDTLSGLPTDTALGTFRTATGTSQVTGREILEAVRQGARWDNLHLAGYNCTHIGTHSLCSGGATRLCPLEGFNKDVIQLMGQWSSDTYLKYIQPQI
jgi:hypothetical protein